MDENFNVDNINSEEPSSTTPSGTTPTSTTPTFGTPVSETPSNEMLEKAFIKDDAYYEELYRKYMESKKKAEASGTGSAGGKSSGSYGGKSAGSTGGSKGANASAGAGSVGAGNSGAPKKKSIGWIILIIAIAAGLVIILMLIKPWNAFDKKEGESVDVFATEDNMNQEVQHEEETAEAVETVADESVESQEDTGAAEEATEETVPPNVVEWTGPVLTPEQVAEAAQQSALETSPQPDTANTQNTQVQQDVTLNNAPSENSQSSGAYAGITFTNSPTQDNTGALSPNEISAIDAVVADEGYATPGIDFFVVTGSGVDGMSDAQYATEYYKKLCASGNATGSGVVIFINTKDMTVHVVSIGNAAKYVNASVKNRMIDEFVSIFRSNGSYSDAAISAYYMAQEAILNGYDAENTTESSTEDWIVIED